MVFRVRGGATDRVIVDVYVDRAHEDRDLTALVLEVFGFLHLLDHDHLSIAW